LADTGDLSRADGAGSEFKYRAFISYSHRDTGWATWLHKSIENYRPPRHLVGQQGLHGPIPKRLAPVFRDREELPSATNLGGVISRALLTGRRPVEVGQRRDSGVQAARPGGPDLLRDHRRRAERCRSR
jgi:hypothetical protein